MAKKVQLRFHSAKHKPSGIDGIDIYFNYEIITTTKDGRKKPIESAKPYIIRVLISGSLAMNWGFGIWRPSEEYNDLIDLLFPYAVEHVKQQYKLGTLKELEEVKLLNKPSEPEYEIDEYGPVVGFEEFLEENDLTEDVKEVNVEISTASEIIEYRDHVNTLVYSKTQKRLLEIDQERNLNELFTVPSSKEEFWYSLASLANLVGKINKDCILDLMKNPTKETGTIKQLEVYLKTLSPDINNIIIPLKSINHVRQGYPIHTDKVKNYITTLKYFGLDYPITDYSKSWNRILKGYSDALRKLFELLKEHLK